MNDEILTLNNNPEYGGLAYMRPVSQYSEAHPDCQIITLEPHKPQNAAPERRPLIVFVQGSGWTSPNMYAQIPMLSAFARRGYVVATIKHRSILDGYAALTYLVDVKTAIRYLRANREQYDIDPERVCVWGTSSGGNAALLVGVTAEDARYRTDEYADQKDGVQAVIDCFGPSDMYAMHTNKDFNNMEIAQRLSGARPIEEVITEMSPLMRLKSGTAYPPTLLMHGDADNVVPYEQSLAMYQKLRALNQRAKLVRVTGGVHEGNFWSDDIVNVAAEFIKATIG